MPHYDTSLCVYITLQIFSLRKICTLYVMGLWLRQEKSGGDSPIHVVFGENTVCGRSCLILLEEDARSWLCWLLHLSDVSVKHLSGEGPPSFWRLFPSLCGGNQLLHIVRNAFFEPKALLQLHEYHCLWKWSCNPVESNCMQKEYFSMQSGGDSEASWLHPVKLWRNIVECSYLISRRNHYFLLLKLLNSSPATGRKAGRALSKENVSSIRITVFGSASGKLRRSWRRDSCSFIIYRTSLWKSAAISW